MYDGECGFCRDIVDRIRSRDRARRFRFVPYQDEVALRRTGVSRQEASHAMVLITEDGSRFAGGDAAARVIERRPRGRLVGRLLRLPGVRRIVGVGYRLIAENRHAVSRFTGTAACEPSERP